MTTAPMDIQKARAQFPLLAARVRNKAYTYLDSAATTLKPWQVIERISHFYSYETANVHRGAHYLADQATTYFEESRETVRQFLNAQSTDEVIFTKGTTESINLLASTLATKVKSGDEILLTEMEHHANLVPWQMLAEKAGAKIVVAPILDNGELDLKKFESLLSTKTKIAAFTHCSNTLGTVNPVKQMTAMAHKVGALVCVDGAQAVANRAVDVQDLDVDFYSFSVHKIFGPYGVGILYGKRNLLDSLGPYQGGGSMIAKVDFQKTEYNDLPFRLEAGTPNIEGVIATKAALDFVKAIGWESIHAHEQKLLKYLTSQLLQFPEVTIYGQAAEKIAIVSFNLKGAHAADVGQILDQENVAVRVGHHCTQPLLKHWDITATVRASLSVYNNEKDVDTFIAAVKKAKDLLL